MTSRTRTMVSLAALAALGVWGCNASQPKQVEDPDPLGLGADMEEVDEDDGATADYDDSEGSSTDDQESSGESDETLDGSRAGPQFTDDMSVAQAQSAVPPDAERLNMEQDVLATPLQDGELYAPCKLGGGHFTANVAVWDGRVVGLDLETQPKNPALAKCLSDQIRKVRWRDKVKSLNTVEFSF